MSSRHGEVFLGSPAAAAFAPVTEQAMSITAAHKDKLLAADGLADGEHFISGGADKQLQTHPMHKTNTEKEAAKGTKKEEQ